MSNLTVQLINSNLVVDLRLIAEELGIQHKSLKDLICTYQSDFEVFGEVTLVAAQGKSLPQGGFGQAETYYYLNEDQSYLSLTYSKTHLKLDKQKLI
jgi:phage regulator Rha-like protein